MNMKLLYVILLLSVGVNVFIGGVVLGREFGGRGVETRNHETADTSLKDKRDKRVPSPHITMRRLAGLLPAEQRRALARALRSRSDELQQATRDRRALEGRIKELLVAPELDEDALEAALKDHSNAVRVLQDTPKELLLRVAPDLALEKREALADRLFRRPPRPGQNRR